MASEKNIIFWDSFGLEQSYEISQEDTSEKNFSKVQVVYGTWILYEQVKYNAYSEGYAKWRILNPGSQHVLEFSPGSFWRAIDERDSIVLFEHIGYAGHRKLYKIACPDVTQEFPTGTSAGASSLIIWPSKPWEMFIEKDYKGSKKELRSGWYSSVIDGNTFPNDSLASIRPA